MKTISTLILVLVLFFNGDAQHINKKITFESSNKPSLTVPCNPNSFWLNYEDSINWGQFNICEYTLFNNTITKSILDIKDVKNASVGYSRNFTSLNNFAFYNVDYNSTTSIQKFDGNVWSTLPINNLQYDFYNSGGYDTSIYFLAKNIQFNFINTVFFYNELNLYPIFYIDSTEAINIPDISVQSDHKIIVFSSPITNLNLFYKLIIVNIKGNNSIQYPIKINSNLSTLGAYGTFIQNVSVR